MVLKCILKCVTSNCKPPQDFDFPETKLLFRFVWFEKSQYVYYSRWKKGSYIACHLFYLFIKWGKFQPGKSLEKSISNTTNSSKNIQKTLNCPTRTHERGQILLRRFLDKYTQFPTYHSFFGSGDETSKNVVGGSMFLKNLWWKPKGEG